MDSALLIHRLQFAFTVTYHYLFPQLTMGLAPLIVALKTLALWKKDEKYNDAARFWAKIFGINFVFGVVTGIPMEFQFGTNWSHFSRAAGGVIGQTLAMEGTFAFFLESTFLGLFLYGEKRLKPLTHWFSALAVFLGSWLSGYFIVATDAWMQHPQGYTQLPDGSFTLSNYWDLVLNQWAVWQYLHNMSGALMTGAFVMMAVGAFYLLRGLHKELSLIFIKTGLAAGFIAAILVMGPTGDQQGVNVARYQPATLAAMEAQFNDQRGAGITVLGQPDVEHQRIDNPIYVPGVLSLLVNRDFGSEIKGLNSFPRENWPTSIPLLYFSYHIMIGLGTIFAFVLLIGVFLWQRKKLGSSNWYLWILMLSFPLPYVANTAGWMTAELGRQPWLIYGLQRTIDGYSKTVSAGNGWFTMLGFLGMYTLLSILFLFMMTRELGHGPVATTKEA